MFVQTKREEEKKGWQMRATVWIVEGNYRGIDGEGL